MRSIFWLRHRFAKEGPKGRLYLVASMILLFVIFDGLIMYLAPVVMDRAGIPLGMVGLIIGSSSLAGLLADVIIIRLLPNATYRLLFFIMFIAAAAVPFFLFGTSALAVYIIAMAVWGFYYDLYEVGSLDFVDEDEAPRAQTSSFGVLNAFEGTGYLVAPFVASLLLVYVTATYAFTGWTLAFLLVAFILYVLVSFTKAPRESHDRTDKLGVLLKEGFWRKTGVALLPAFLLTLTINLVDSAVWTMGPVLSESLTPGQTGGALMIAYMIPPLLSGWFVGKLSLKFGKKSIALISLLVGSLALIFIAPVKTPILDIAAIFVASFFWSLVWPILSAAYTQRMSRTGGSRREIETVDDVFINLGDILGPIIIGYSAQLFGLRNSFAVDGAIGVLMALLLFRLAPKDLIKKSN